MPRGDYSPEIRSGMQTGRTGRVETSPPMRNKQPEPGPGDTPAEMRRDAARGIVEGSAADERMDAMQAKAGMANPPKMQMQTAGSSNLPPDLHHVAAATSIAHAILGRRPGGM